MQEVPLFRGDPKPRPLVCFKGLVALVTRAWGSYTQRQRGLVDGAQDGAQGTLAYNPSSWASHFTICKMETRYHSLQGLGL